MNDQAEVKPGPHILMFEDSEETMGGLRDYLVRRLHWRVELTADAAVLQRLGVERYDLILLDVMIHSHAPKTSGSEQQNVSFEGVPWRMTGLQFLQRLRRGDYAVAGGTRPDVPVIIVSAALGSSVKSEVEQDRNVFGVFEKPFVLSALLHAMQGALAAGPAARPA
jgi:CheY-like chemotaxis protein